MAQMLLTAILTLAVASARAASIAYVTDLPLYSALAPCAQSALKYGVQTQTYSACPEDATALQSCVCTKNNNLASIKSKVSVSISYSCGSTASDDQASAQTVLSAYCNPDATVTFQSPTAVTDYITDIPEFGYLAPCAQSALRHAVGTVTWDSCPTDAPGLASCACFKNQNSLVISQLINSEAKQSCSGHTVDISSAQAMFAAYCLMNNGTTSFPVPTNPPGDMTYYITDLPQFSSLAPCAASGLSYAIQSQTYRLCAEGPQALASCVCLKDTSMTNEMLKSITSSVKYSCDATASEDVSSAVAVYNMYCDAAAAKVTAAGVTNSVEQSYPASRAPAGPNQTGGSGTGTGSGSGSGSGSGNGGSNGDGSAGSAEGNSTSGSSGPSTGAIVGGVVGGIGGLALLGALIFFVMKRVRKGKSGALPVPDTANPANRPPGGPVGFGGKAELPSDSAAASPPPPSPSPSTLKVGAVPARGDTVSPVSDNTSSAKSPPNQAELSGQSTLYPPMPNRPELLGQSAAAPPPPSPNASELYGQGSPSPNRPELQGQGAMYPPPPPNMSELQGQGSQFQHPDPNRPELAGQYSYPSPQSPPVYPSPVPSPQPQQMQAHQQVYHHPGTPPVGGPAMYGQPHPQASWQAGPVPGYHEMDASGPGVPSQR
ncbi:uncharacterized protein B0T15DRAFT_272618 [Chaetomium strumarium]|uniref:Uncharacterized protein n=1 Tax=Chaetomium strumarium TaxID=1170767 RepID=A0AAJ0GNS9_9PEZI|nr:hypothetical protein B0T15DRAFT_272618 [Chaetomium strumarium]